MGVRPGSEKDTKARAKAYGATTLEGRHVVDDEGGVWLRFVGKEGQHLNLPVMDDALAKTLLDRARQAGPDGRLFRGASAAKLLAHTKAVTGDDKYLSKDFRTLLGTRTAAALVASLPPPPDKKSYQKTVMDIATQVSAKLGNKPAMALKAYINPTVFAPWQLAA
jgi:DNA topoisomerase-1